MMRNRKQTAWLPVTVLLMLSVPGICHAQTDAHPVPQNMADMKFVPFPGMPACTTGSVQSGDPAKGASIILAKAVTGCAIPWHWHTPNENLMMVAGTARAEMKDGKAVTLQAGAFALMPAKHVHRFTCTKTCLLYIYSDAAFDIHYVDGQGNEIPPDDSRKPAKSAPAKTLK